MGDVGIVNKCCLPNYGEDTKRNFKHAKRLRRRGALRRPIAFDDVENRILTQPEPMAYFPVRLTFADEL